MQPVPGIHHITAMAGDPQRNLDFYHNVLGQRLIKTTVNFDDPGTYHLYYGDEIGSPGTILTFFPWPNARRGVRGTGEVAATGYAIRPNSIDYWRRRLAEHGVAADEAQERFGAQVISFQDPDGMIVELVAVDQPAPTRFWASGPIPKAHALQGFHSATLWVASAQATGQLLTEQLGYALVGAEGNRWRYRAPSDDAGVVIDLLEQPGLARGQLGAGSVHHIAFRARDDAEQADYQRSVREAGFQVTPVRDRQYFRSIYFREPNGVLFEIATDDPGFALDEPVDELGTALKLPPWLEPQRGQIERMLPALSVRVDTVTDHV